MISPFVLTGIGLRATHYTDLLDQRPPLAWLEIHSENYFGEGGRHLHMLEKIREHYPISMHGVSLSLGSTDDLNWQHLKKTRDLAMRIDACLISEHLAWCSIDGRYLHDLLPLPYTEEALELVVQNIMQVQEYLNRQILIENISSYVTYDYSNIPESAFLTEVSKRSGCGILLDINNIYVNSVNLNYCPRTYIKSIPSHLVQEIHLGGFTQTKINDKDVLIDSHNQSVADTVWDLYRETIQHINAKPTIIEWDSDLPSLATLCDEALCAEKMIRDVYAAAKYAR